LLKLSVIYALLASIAFLVYHRFNAKKDIIHIQVQLPVQCARMVLFASPVLKLQHRSIHFALQDIIATMMETKNSLKNLVMQVITILREDKLPFLHA
jgi:hypothetical protein